MIYGQNKEEFKKQAGFPGIWGVIDGTHIPVTVRKAERQPFYGRFKYTTMNLEAIVGPDMAFIEFVCRWPGSAHDSTIFKSTQLYAQLKSTPVDGHMIGDAGYAIESFLMVPFRQNAIINDPDKKRYNKCLSSTRSIVERAFGSWKNKFQCLKGLRVELQTAILVMTACAALWNFTLAEGEKLLPEEEGEELGDWAGEPPSGQGSQASAQGTAKREQIVAYLASVAASNHD